MSREKITGMGPFSGGIGANAYNRVGRDAVTDFNVGMMVSSQKNHGFTLIELMIAVAIIGILTSIAYPSYVKYINDTWRNTAQACLVEMSQTMERRFAANMAYDDEIDSNGDGIDDMFQSGCSDEGGIDSRYGFAFIGAVSTGTYALQAVPQGAQANDECKTQTLNHVGVKGVGRKATKSVDQCW